MFVVGLTGGMGAGKSTLAALLAERGAQIIDADALAHDALRPNGAAWHSVVDQFGREILAPYSMDIGRSRLADIVFSNRHKLAALNAIVHPVVLDGIANALEKLHYTDEIVVLDAALMVETGLDKDVDQLIVVAADVENRRRRVSRARDMSFAEVDARIAAQIDQEQLLAKADIVVRNDGTLEDLAQEADRVWKELQARRDDV